MLRLRLDLMISEVFSKLGMGPLEEPNPRPGPGTLQVGQMGQAHNWCPILLWLMPLLFCRCRQTDTWPTVLLLQLQSLQQS